MMKKRNVILICAVAILGIVTFAVVQTKSKSATIEQNYHVADVDAVTKLYLSNKLDDKYISPRGEQRNLEILLEDMEVFYKDAPNFNTFGRYIVRNFT